MKTKLLIVLCLLPVALLLGFLARYGVNAFAFDHWNDTLPMIAHSLNGTLTWDDLWKQHAEHRLFFPRLIMLGLAHLTHWNAFAEVAVEILLALVTLGNLAMICKQTKASPWLLPVASLFLFTPMAYEVWMCGYMLHYWLPIACFTAIPWLVNCRWPLVTCGVVSFVATYSIANGFLAWLIALPLLYLKGDLQRRLDLICYACIPLVQVTAYFINFEWNPALTGLIEPTSGGIVRKLVQFTAYLGNGFGSLNAMIVVGAVLLLAFAMGSIMIFRQKRLLEFMPWLAVACIPLACSAMTVHNRLHYSLDQVPRYIPFACLFAIAVLFIGSKLVSARWLMAGFVPLVALSLLGTAAVAPKWANHRRLMLISQYLTRCIDIAPPQQIQDAICGSIIVKLESPPATLDQIRVLGRHDYVDLFKPGERAEAPAELNK